jgi:hypothetical protein
MRQCNNGSLIRLQKEQNGSKMKQAWAGGFSQNKAWAGDNIKTSLEKVGKRVYTGYMDQW